MMTVPGQRPLGIALLCLWLGACAPAQPPRTVAPAGTTLLLQHVRVFDPVKGSFSDTVDILIRGDHIAAVGTLHPEAKGTQILDAGGRFALPGLWDSHVHLSFLTPAGDSAVVRTLAEFVRHGVTSVRDVGGNLDSIAGLSRRVERGDLVGPRIFFAGPLLTKAPVMGALNEFNKVIPGTAVGVTSPGEIDLILDRLVVRNASMAKAIDYWDPILLRYLLRAAQARSLRVVLDPGVAILNSIPVDTALALGVTSIEHAQAAWAGILNAEVAHERDSVMAVGVTSGDPDLALRHMMTLGEQSVSRERLDRLADRWARNGAYFTPTLQTVIDAVARTPEGDWRRALEGRLAVGWLAVRVLAAHGVKMLVGQDGFEPDGALREMDLLAAVGISPAEILRGATIYPARWLGVDSTMGTLEPGKRADILILEANPLDRITNIRSAWAVVSRGKIISGPQP
jgi:hypothetical protein